MTQISQALENESFSSPHAIGANIEVLRQVTAPATNFGVWQRPVEPSIARELAFLRAQDMREMRRQTSQDSFCEDVCDVLREQGLDPQAFQCLRADMSRLADCFFDVTQASEARFRLVATDSDDCRRFHVDRVQMRMLCTYRGPGTEWLPDEQVDRVAQASCAPNEAIIRFGEPSQLETFWVGMMKGDPKNEGTGLVHRSPAISGSGQTRVLFCMDC